MAEHKVGLSEDEFSEVKRVANSRGMTVWEYMLQSIEAELEKIKDSQPRLTVVPRIKQEDSE